MKSAFNTWDCSPILISCTVCIPELSEVYRISKRLWRCIRWSSDVYRCCGRMWGIHPLYQSLLSLLEPSSNKETKKSYVNNVVHACWSCGLHSQISLAMATRWHSCLLHMCLQEGILNLSNSKSQHILTTLILGSLVTRLKFNYFRSFVLFIQSNSKFVNHVYYKYL